MPTNSRRTTSRPSLPARRLAAAAAATILLASCGSGGGSDAKATTTTTAPTTTTTTEIPLAKAGKAFQTLIEGADKAVSEETVARDAFAAKNDLQGALDSAGGLKADLASFQSDLKDLEVPKDKASVIDKVDTSTGAFIQSLEGYAQVTDVPGYNAQLKIEGAASDDWYAALKDAAKAFEVAGVGTGSGSDSGKSDSGTSSGATLTGDGSQYCLREGDLPKGFLPLTGSDNMSNALGYGFTDPDTKPADKVAQDHLKHSWMVLPDGGASMSDATATCVIYLFDTPGSASEFYSTWADSYGADSSPSPTEVDPPSGTPGTDPHAFTDETGSRPDANVIYLYGNAVVDVEVTGASSTDIDTVSAASAELATTVYDRLVAAS